jgi:hypothetical protein
MGYEPMMIRSSHEVLQSVSLPRDMGWTLQAFHLYYTLYVQYYDVAASPYLSKRDRL